MNHLMQILREWAASQPLAIREETWRRLAQASTRPESAAGAEELRAVIGLTSSGTPTVPTIALIPLRGLVMQHDNLWTALGLAVSTERFAAQVRAAAADPSVVAIVLDIDSPGGGVYGVDEAAASIREARESKPIVAVANSQAASAAYWIASAASELVVTPSGEVGSVGVFAEHEDASGFYANIGLAITIVKAGRYKAEFADTGPLTEEARAELQRAVDEYYDLFIGAVAKGRGVTPATIRTDYGEGRMLSAKRAVAAGMADRVGTLQETLARLVKLRRPAGTRAEETGADFETRRRRLGFREQEG